MCKKLTQEVFTRPECPKWAKWAAVNRDGTAFWFEAMPYTIQFAPYWRKQSGTESQRLDGEFCSSDWRNSLIKRQYTNLDYLCEHPKELAKKLVRCFDDRIGIFLAPDDKMFCLHDCDTDTSIFDGFDQTERRCIEYTVNWLKQEHKENKHDTKQS